MRNACLWGVCSQLGAADVRGDLRHECGDGVGSRQTVFSVVGDQSISGL